MSDGRCAKCGGALHVVNVRSGSNGSRVRERRCVNCGDRTYYREVRDESALVDLTAARDRSWEAFGERTGRGRRG